MRRIKEIHFDESEPLLQVPSHHQAGYFCPFGLSALLLSLYFFPVGMYFLCAHILFILTKLLSLPTLSTFIQTI